MNMIILYLYFYFCTYFIGDDEENSYISTESSASTGLLFSKSQPLNFDYPKRKFGQGPKQSFNPSWYKSFSWLHYEVGKDVVLCATCVSQEKKGNLTLSSKKEDAFLSTGFSNWKKALEKFRKHENSNCHLEAASMSVIRETHENLGEMLSDTLTQEKFENRQILLKILENVRFLRRQGLPFRGNDQEGNFDQMLFHSSKTDSRITEWLKKKSGKYTHPSIQNEYIKIMALSILRDVARNIQNGVFYTIMADEVTDSSNQEQFVLCLRWVDEDLNPHEELVGLYVVPNICADTLVACIRDVLIRMNLTLKNCRGQCYDGASNMSGAKSGVATQIKAKEPRAIFTHCYGHSLQLAVGDMIKDIKILKDVLDTTFEISKLLKYSLKKKRYSKN